MSYQTISSHSTKLNVPSSQALQTSLSKAHKVYHQKLPATTSVAWGGNVTIPIREKGKLLTGIQLEFQVSALSGLSNSSGSQYLLPCQFWPTKIEVFHGNTNIETIYPTATWAISQITASSDAKRSLLNSAAGNAFSTSSLVTKSASAGYWYLPLVLGPWCQSGFPLVTTADLELRITLDSLSNLWGTTFGTATGTPSVTFTSLQAITSMVELPPQMVDYHSSLLRRSPVHHVFLDMFSQQFTIASGTSSSSLVLSSITGNVAFLVFCIRSSSPTGANLITFNTGLSNFAILSAGGENIVGGSSINTDLSRYVQFRDWFNTTFTSDTNGVYVYSHVVDPLEVYNNGSALGGRVYTGSEQLSLTFSSSLASAVQVDVFAFTYAAIEIGASGSRKFAI